MKKNLLVIIFLFIIFTISCQKKIPKQNSSESIISNKLSKNKIYKSLFVKANNGLNYRGNPNGKILGKFIYNKELKIVKNTSIKQEIIDNGKILNGEWLGVLNNKDTVYVFSGFLSNYKDVSLLISENDHYINVDNLNNKESKVQEIKNDTIQFREIKLIDFISIKEINKKEFEIVYQNNIKSKDLQISKKDSVLNIKCFNDKNFKFQDKYSEYDEENEIFSYSTTFEDINCHLINMSGWEWGENFLINYKTCKSIEINGYPVFNKDYSKMICFNDDLGDESIFINSFDGFNFHPKYRLNLPIIPDRFSIDNNEDLYLECVSEWNDGKQHKVSRQYFKFIFTK